MYIIAQDGSGDFTTIQSAIDALPGGGRRSPAILLLRAGEYRERVVINKDHVRIIGEDREKTVITWSACAKDLSPDGKEKGTFLSFSVLAAGRNIEMENLTIRNDAGDGRQVGQAVALYAAGDRGIYRNCRLIAHQDTLFCGPVMPKVEAEAAPRALRAPCVASVGDCPETDARQYFENCFIQGDIDFIFGPYRCWFEGCTLFMNERGGFYTAANTPKDQPYGMVFHRCVLTGACEAGKAYLGRPWRRYARTVFLACSMEECVSPRGFQDWDEERQVTERYGEWDSCGARAGQTARHPRQKRMREEDALAIRLPEVLGGWDGWRPDRRVPTWFLCGDSTMANYGADRYPMMGWGQKLPSLLEEGVYVENCAVNGRSSKSFWDENRLFYISLCLRPGDRLIVSFGHNDEKEDPARGTNAADSFPAYLQRYLDTARRHGAEPILATPIARRHFDAAGHLIPTHRDYPEAIRRLAARQGVRMIDLERATMAFFQRAGVEGTKEYFCHAAPGKYENYPEGVSDNSHLQERGAIRVAALFLALLSGEKTAPAFAASTPTPVPQTDSAETADLIAREDSVMD